LLIGILLGAGATYALAAPTLNRTATYTKVTTVTTTNSPVTRTSTATVTVDPGQEVSDAYSIFFQNIESRNATALAAEYQDNATLNVYGYTDGVGGSYNGSANIFSFYNALLSNGVLATVNLKNVTYGIYVSETGQSAEVSSMFTMHGSGFFYGGNSENAGTYNATVRSVTSYALVGEEWLITSDSWDFTLFNFA
jgi:hypothetical protein